MKSILVLQCLVIICNQTFAAKTIRCPQVQEMAKKLGFNEGSLFYPKCDKKTKKYELKQCSKITSNCVCVDINKGK